MATHTLTLRSPDAANLRPHQSVPSLGRLGYLAAVSDYEIPEPEPKEIDEKLSLELRHLAANAVLKGKPSGQEKCENCRYYLEPYNDISYCWHQKLRILVGADWWCQWWDAIPEEA
jgi:hypothetical protein